MQENIITWNVPNWVTVILMAGTGFFALGLVMKLVRNRQGGTDNSVPNQTPQQPD